MSYLDDLSQAFNLEKRRYVHLIGGGGKTTLMFTLARVLVRAGQRVLTTTSTRIRRPRASDSRVVFVEEDVEDLIEVLRDAREGTMHVTVGRHYVPEGQKILGFGVTELDALLDAGVADTLLVEADGSKGRSLKAHAEWEPVVSPKADLVIAVIGTDALDCPLEDAHVHRADRFARLLGRDFESTVSADDIATAFFHANGYLRTVSPESDVYVYLSKSGTGEGLKAAADISQALAEADRQWRIGRFVAGELKGRRFAEVLMDREG